MFKFTEAVSFSVDCKNQEEVDYYWNRLSEGGEESQCGWQKVKFGLSWQVVPSGLGKFIYHPNPEKALRVMQALFKMRQIDKETLKQAFSRNPMFDKKTIFAKNQFNCPQEIK